MLKWYSADLHIHTVLSPCGDLSMGPRDILASALEKKINIIAITDHNSAENVQAVMGAAEGTNLKVIAGMEVYVREGVHIICLFPALKNVMTFQKFVYANLQKGVNDESLFGAQIVCDKDENILNENQRLLALPINASLEKIAHYAGELGGIVYPAHVDRQSFSILRVLGFIPDDLNINAVEISQPLQEAQRRLRFLRNTNYTIIRASDAHFVDNIGDARTFFKLAEPSFSEISMAIRRQNGRRTALELPEEKSFKYARTIPTYS
ncbi:MAG: PHP domain-containing protein [Calditrichaeota bacterium]|nr:PHP domain-containing protein [Calditrichota bacterium]